MDLGNDTNISFLSESLVVANVTSECINASMNITNMSYRDMTLQNDDTLVIEALDDNLKKTNFQQDSFSPDAQSNNIYVEKNKEMRNESMSDISSIASSDITISEAKSDERSIFSDVSLEIRPLKPDVSFTFETIDVNQMMGNMSGNVEKFKILKLELAKLSQYKTNFLETKQKNLETLRRGELYNI